MILRPAVPDDAQQVADIDLTARYAAMPNVRWAYPPHVARAWIRDTLIPSGTVYVLEKEGVLLGYMASRGAWIDHLYIRPGRWRAGLGSALVAFAKQRNPKGLTCYCFQCNLPARAFYERHGFTAVALTNGEGNEEEEPDILYSWPGPEHGGGQA